MQAGSGKAPVTPVVVRVAICALVWEKWVNRPPSALSALFRAIWRKQPINLADRGCRAAKNGREPGGGRQGRNVCRLKGGWLLQASRSEKRHNVQQSWAFAKSVRKKKMPPTDAGFHKNGWHIKRIIRKQGIHVGGIEVDRRK